MFACVCVVCVCVRERERERERESRRERDCVCTFFSQHYALHSTKSVEKLLYPLSNS